MNFEKAGLTPCLFFVDTFAAADRNIITDRLFLEHHDYYPAGSIAYLF